MGKIDQPASIRGHHLVHPILPGMTTYPGLPGPVLSDFLSREDSRGRYALGTTFSIVRIEMVANTGTYVDAPFPERAFVSTARRPRFAAWEAFPCAPTP